MAEACFEGFKVTLQDFIGAAFLLDVIVSSVAFIYLGARAIGLGDRKVTIEDLFAAVIALSPTLIRR